MEDFAKQLHLTSQQSLDKYVLTISSGAIILSWSLVTGIKHELGTIECSFLVFISLSSLLSTIVLVLGSIDYTISLSRKMILEFSKPLAEQDFKIGIKDRDGANRFKKLSHIFFCVGLVSLLIFVFINLVRL